MSLFSKNQFVLWPKSKTVEVYSNRKDQNTASFDLNLLKEQTDQDLQSLSFYLKKNKIKNVSVLLSDDLVVIRSFVYDSKISSIEKKELLSLSQAFINFPMEEDSLEYELVNDASKTTIRTTIYDLSKIKILKSNLARLKLKTSSFLPASVALCSLINSFYKQEYFLIFPQGTKHYLLVLAKGKDVYLSTCLKGDPLDIQKTVNYSNLYFSTVTKKIFLPRDNAPEIISTTKMEKTPFDQSQIAQNFHQAPNLPLPVLAIMVSPNDSNPDIINIMETENNNQSNSPPKKKNILPLIAVFVLTSALASVLIWYVLNRSDSTSSDQPESALAPTSVLEPTSVPLPTLAPIDKDLKISVLNATDINGQAGAFKAKLTELGFTDVAVGNSKESLTSNIIKTKKETLATFSAYFKDKLSDYFPADYQDSLEADSTYDLVFIVGTNLSQPSPSPSPVLEESNE
ncbi:LytR C-terminal domain-containing protein [Patescibacteria group bacterium]|nr:LytR C-terminal domain-containing protein [Patescibacteria group bacterium]